MRNQRGQSLIEYLIVVALMGVATIGVMRVLSQTVTTRFANVALAIQGKAPGKAHVESVNESVYKKRDMSDFFSTASKPGESANE
jgi:pilus assembly protein Flp/PilA